MSAAIAALWYRCCRDTRRGRRYVEEAQRRIAKRIRTPLPKAAFATFRAAAPGGLELGGMKLAARHERLFDESVMTAVLEVRYLGPGARLIQSLTRPPSIERARFEV